jgi:hypothetical protein
LLAAAVRADDVAFFVIHEPENSREGFPTCAAVKLVLGDIHLLRNERKETILGLRAAAPAGEILVLGPDHTSTHRLFPFLDFDGGWTSAGGEEQEYT